jgi:hypothetical protein
MRKARIECVKGTRAKRAVGCSKKLHTMTAGCARVCSQRILDICALRSAGVQFTGSRVCLGLRQYECEEMARERLGSGVREGRVSVEHGEARG